MNVEKLENFNYSVNYYKNMYYYDRNYIKIRTLCYNIQQYINILHIVNTTWVEFSYEGAMDCKKAQQNIKSTLCWVVMTISIFL